MRPKTRFFTALSIAVIIILSGAVFSACGENTFDIKRIGNIHPYADNAFRITSSEAGVLEISIHDNSYVYRTIRENIPAGETVIHWDGCGYNREKLYEKTYTVTAKLKTEDDVIHTISFDSPVEYAVQCLQYALTSSDVIYLDRTKEWFIEYRTVTKGTLTVEFRSKESPDMVFSYTINAEGGKIARKDLSSIAGKKKIPQTGEYVLTVYENSRPDEKYEARILIEEKTPAREQVGITGEIMADRNMSDREIWEMMMKPSVVVDIDSFRHQDIYEKPDASAQSLGTLHGQSQGVKVILIEDDWAKIGAWNHEEAEYVEGWVPLSRLKVETPRQEYGILIDKQKQTMTVYRNGEKIDTLLISTGRAEKNNLYQETSAGCFLTGYHRVNFSMNGKKYDYVIQYDGGNLLHQTPYDWGQQKKDFTLGRGYLGAKASHACIRIQPEPGEGGLNAYWLFTHIPYHTRVMILDDPLERVAYTEKLKRNEKTLSNMQTITTYQYGTKDDQKVDITFGGSLIPGGSRSFNSRKNSFASAVQNSGYDKILKNLAEIFESDDLTCVNLCCPVQKDPDLFPEEKGTVFAVAGTERIFENASVELIQMTSSRLHVSGQSFYEDTAEILNQYADVLCEGQSVTYTLKGHLFGFTGCNEEEYLKDTGIIDRRISELKEKNCEIMIMLINWSDGHDHGHSIVQEAMAHRAVRAGVHLVVGNCPGLVQGFDLIEGVPVIYSLGDLLNGSTPGKPKSQEGFLFRLSFCFEGKTSISVTAIPILPYGNNETDENEYNPSVALSDRQFENAVGYIWTDSTDQALQHLQFYIEEKDNQ